MEPPYFSLRYSLPGFGLQWYRLLFAASRPVKSPTTAQRLLRWSSRRTVGLDKVVDDTCLELERRFQPQTRDLERWLERSLPGWVR